jgi:hypothetical protein
MSWQPPGHHASGWQPEGWQPEAEDEPPPAPTAPVQISDIPSIVALLDSGEHEYALSQYFSDADSYAIAPALETGWSFDTDTGLLTIDTDDEDEFGPFTVTATNDVGDTESNEFSITVTDRFLGFLLPTLRHQDETLVHQDGTLRHQRVAMHHRR